MKKIKLIVDKNEANLIHLILALKINHSLEKDERPFIVTASDYEKAIKNNRFLPKDIELVRVRDYVAYAISRTKKITIIWIPLKYVSSV